MEIKEICTLLRNVESKVPKRYCFFFAVPGRSVSTTARLLSEVDESSDTALLLAEAIAGLPPRERDFVLDFVATHSRHWKAGQRG